MAAQAPSPLHEGRSLRRARRRRHVTLEEAAGATFISRRFLEALEDEAPLDAFPAPVYARAFLREYAKYLGLPSEGLVEAFDRRHEPEEVEPGLVALPDLMPRRRWPARVAVLASVAILLAIALSHGHPSKPTPVVAPTHHVLTGGLPTGPGQPIPARTVPRSIPRPVTGIRVVLHVVAPCWIRASGDGTVLLPAGIVGAGRSLTLLAHRTLAIRLGNGGGVRLTVNGRPVRTGGPGQVVDLSFAVRGGHVVVI